VPRLLGDYYATTAKNGPVKWRQGDRRTPLGVYFTTGRLPGVGLPDFYGYGALPVNYPNVWDRRLGRTGYGIWIHGVPSHVGHEHRRPPRDSDGCVVLANEDMSALWLALGDRSVPVIIANGIEWVAAPELERRRLELARRIEAWRGAWQSRDLQAYAEFYAGDFQADELDYRDWMDKKRRINVRKTFVEVGLQEISIFGYPGERDMAVVTFDQDYRSSDFNDRVHKHQYWRREADGLWRIAYEATPKLEAVHLRGVPPAVLDGVKPPPGWAQGFASGERFVAGE